MPQLVSERESKRKWWTVWAILVICIIVTGISVGGFCYIHFLLQVSNKVTHSLYREANGQVCVTKECLEATIDIMSSLDISQDPCVDFYQFSCGKFIEEAYKKDKPSPYLAQINTNKQKLRAIISEPIKRYEERPLFLQKRFYQSCMNITAIDEDGTETFKKLLENLGGWPLMKRQKSDEAKINLGKLLVKCKEMGFPFQWFFEITYENNRIYIGPPKITRQYNEPFEESAYDSLMVETAVTMGAPKLLAENEIHKIRNFELKLKDIVSKNTLRNEISLMDANKLYNPFPQFSWLHFINNLTGYANFVIVENDTVAVADTYLRELSFLLERTPKRVQLNYIGWKIIEDFGQYLSNPLREYFGNFTDFMVPNLYQTNTRSEFCIKEAITRFPHIAELEFIRLYADEEKSKDVKDMVANIKDQFILRLKTANWIDDETKEIAINKVKNIVEILGYHKLDFDEAVSQKFLNTANLEFTSNNIIEMIREKNLYDFKQIFLLADVPIIDSVSREIFNAALDVSAKYREVTNTLHIAAGAMQGNLYSENRPNYLNYGALGSIIGHEIAHGFTKHSLSHDSDEEREIILSWFNESVQGIHNMGLLNTTQLWENDTLEVLLEKTQCIVDDYERFHAGIGGNETLEENFADLIGINVAYDTYIKWLETYGDEAKLPKLQYTSQQLFWIQFGTTRCFQEIHDIDSTVTDDKRFRVINPLRNSENFAKDFNCPVGAPMNPEYKCHVF